MINDILMYLIEKNTTTITIDLSNTSWVFVEGLNEFNAVCESPNDIYKLSLEVCDTNGTSEHLPLYDIPLHSSEEDIRNMVINYLVEEFRK